MKKKNYDKYLNLLGMRCPDPIISIRKHLKNIKKEKILFIISDDISIKHELPIFCCCLGYTILEKKTDNVPYEYLIKK